MVEHDFPRYFSPSPRHSEHVKWLCLVLPLVWLIACAKQEPELKLQLSVASVRSALTNVVESQLAAFRTKDYATAYTFATAGIKEKFPLNAFEQMVKTGYPIIAASRSARFGDCFDNGRKAILNLTVIGRGGQMLECQYLLELEGDRWKIAGVIQRNEEKNPAAVEV